MNTLQCVDSCDGIVVVQMDPGVPAAAQLFKVLGSESRLALLLLVERGPTSVGELSRASGLSQPLVSQHLRTLRQVGLVAAVRQGKEVCYRLADHHVAHVIADALAHVRETTRDADTTPGGVQS